MFIRIKVQEEIWFGTLCFEQNSNSSMWKWIFIQSKAFRSFKLTSKWIWTCHTRTKINDIMTLKTNHANMNRNFHAWHESSTFCIYHATTRVDWLHKKNWVTWLIMAFHWYDSIFIMKESLIVTNQRPRVVYYKRVFLNSYHD